MRISRACELCGGRASLHCASDSAFLCFSCDADVHEANFLVARHVRRTLCRSCDAFDGSSVSGVGFPPVQPLCSDCDAEDDDGDRCSAASSSSSACVSNSSAAAANPIRKIGSGRIVSSRFDSGSQIPMGVTASRTAPSRAEGILAIWSRRMGLRNRRSVALALRAYGICLRKFTGLPLHVSLAASLWLAAGRCEPRCGSTCRLLRLIQCSRVPPKLILFVGRRLSRRVVRPTRAKESSRKRRICRVLR